MKLKLEVQGYFTQEEFLNILKQFEMQAPVLFASELTDHEELIGVIINCWTQMFRLV